MSTKCHLKKQRTYLGVFLLCLCYYVKQILEMKDFRMFALKDKLKKKTLHQEDLNKI